MAEERAVLHVDMNCFFVSCHVARDPKRLRRRPVVVAGDPAARHGIVLTASYEARATGIRTGMLLSEARACCPRVSVMEPDYSLYRQVSRQVIELLSRFSPLVEPFSIDEAWLDVTGCHRALGTAAAIARAIQERLRSELDLPCSIGVAPNKLLAKMASALQKPNGLVVLGRADVPARIWPLAIEELFGVGPRLARRLRAWNVQTIGDLARVGPEFLRRRLGLVGEHLWDAAHGKDASPVDPSSLGDAKSMGHSLTLPADLTSEEEVDAVLLNLADQVGRRLRRAGLVGLRATVAVRDSRLVNLSRSRSLPAPTDATEAIYAAARALVRGVWKPGDAVRLLGVSVGRLVPACEAVRQPTLFDTPPAAEEKLARAAAAADRVRERWGETALVRAGMLAGRERGRAVLDGRRHGSSLEKEPLRRAVGAGGPQPDPQGGAAEKPRRRGTQRRRQGERWADDPLFSRLAGNWGSGGLNPYRGMAIARRRGG